MTNNTLEMLADMLQKRQRERRVGGRRVCRGGMIGNHVGP